MRLKKLWLYILTPLLVLFGSAALTNTVQAQELKNVITKVGIWETDNGKFVTPDAKGVYNLAPQNQSYENYKFATDFDLSAYDGMLNDGDTFTFTIPAPLSVRAETFELKDKETDTAVGDATVVSNGDNQGGKVTITLKNLAEYLKKKGGTEVRGVSGTFYVAFSSKKETEEESIQLDKTETKDDVNFKMKFKKGGERDYSEGIGKTNISKVNGTINKEKWESALLEKSGDYIHKWNLRVNPKQAEYNKIVVRDWVDKDYSPMQIIPESIVVTAGYYNKVYALVDDVTLEAGKDYEIKWNDSYTEFTITFNNAKAIRATNGKAAAFRIVYNTTAPADGTKVQNNAEITADDQVLPVSDDRTETVTKVIGNSTVTSGGTIQLKTGYRITLYKVDEKSLDRLAGAKFKITPPEGVTTAQEETVTTDASGIAQSAIYTDEDVKKGEFTITEIEAPKGYQLDSTPIKVTVGQEGVIKTISNKRNSTKAQIQAIKKLTGRAMKAGEFEFDLFNDKTNKVVETVTNDADGNINFAELTFDKAGTYNYHIVEKKANTTEKGVTYDANPVGVTVTVTADAEGKLSAAVAYENDDKTFENTYAAEKTSAPIEVTKALTGRTLKADEFEFVLKNDADGSEVQKVKNTADGKVKFSPIDYTAAGTYKYTIVETNAGQTIDGVTYDSLEVKVTVEVTDDGEGKLTANVTYPADKEFNNSYGASKTPAPLAVKKTLTGRELKADEFEFTLTDKDGNVKETVKNDKDGNVKFSALSFDEVGTFTYKITEKAGTATGITYDTKTITATVTVTDNGKGALEATVTYDDEKAFENTYTPAGATSVTLGAKKVLEGKDLEAGKYSFELKKADGTVVETVTNAADGTVTFSPISYDESQVGTHKYTISEVAGTETGITYDKTVKEVEVTVEKVSATELKATASKEANDLVFTNTYTPAKTEVPVKKVWKDANNQDGKRPTSVTVKLLADGQDTGKTLELNVANNWAGSFTNLDADKGGTPIQYTVVEVTVAGYTSDVTGDSASGFTITNSYSPETVDVKATKNWDDANNQDGKRPTKITINLLADGQKVDSKEVQAAADGTWTVEFTKLAKYKAGKEIKYTVTEEAVAEYESTITDFTITNKYAPKAIDYKVTKVWNDANNQDGKRPESVTVQLYKKVGDADPVAVEGKKLTLTAKEKTDDNTWVASFTNLPQYEAGKEITYSIDEVDVPAGYEASVTGQVVTNTHNPETVVLSGTKVWDDNNNQSGKRADKVKVQILNGDKVVQEIEVSEATGWKFESKALPKYGNGTEIKYTVKEVAVKEYTSTVTTDKDGKYTVTNEYTPEKTSVKGKKIWKDEENKDGIRPASITVKLLADGQDTGKTAVASEATGWTYEFTGLERYKDTKGTEFKYSVEEVPVEGYSSKVEGFNITNTHTPEKPTPGKPNEPGKPSPKSQLPNTGEKASSAAVVAGLALMAVTGGLYFVSRKNK
ncbi:Cna B-type domain-containing protein [Streptococcus oralis]|uniref:Cna B-type domain-containing protein n=1 Tax=Streptococcus oralis TaxID=1303 RepID=UPI0001CC5D7B|nr:Cna B-type domain-containing protein [Streptococcus oralis]EFE56456.1 pilin isopeptide linkage domain protein [Streptococcus oralis ATCC 35037]EFO01994.1 collagen adhesin [Streptococcus oralis ATCC 35037]KZX04210.1 adhesin [Streptococcus oralis]OOR77312.1 adhesin [Streptococcus oralis]QQB71714.1 Cna B-type domain-containing protein [Streptococcus oralis]